MTTSSCYKKISSFWGFGLLLICSTAVLACFNRIILKDLSSPSGGADDTEPLPAFYIVMIRQFSILLIFNPAVSLTKAPRFSFSLKIWAFLLIRAFLALAAATTTQFAISLISLPDFVTITALSPILTSLIGWPILKERPKVTDIPLFLCMLTGIAFIVQPGFIFKGSENYSPPDLIGCLYAGASLLGYSFINICLRAVRGVPVASSNFVYGASSSVIALIANVIFFPRLPPCSTWQRVETLLTGLIAALLVALYVLAAKSVPASFLALSGGLELVLQLLLQIMIFKTFPPFFSIIGAAIVLATFALIFIRNFLVYKFSSQRDAKSKLGGFIKFLSI